MVKLVEWVWSRATYTAIDRVLDWGQAFFRMPEEKPGPDAARDELKRYTLAVAEYRAGQRFLAMISNYYYPQEDAERAAADPSEGRHRPGLRTRAKRIIDRIW